MNGIEIGNEIRKAVDKAVEEADDEGPRTHLGISIIGRECPRAVWYSWRWYRFVKHTGRLLRLFSRGHREEASLIKYLEGIGAKVEAVDPATGKQFLVSDLGGHYGGSCDGKVSGLEAFGMNGKGLLEFKTHNEKSFKVLKEKGVQTAKRDHYVQMQAYMGYHGLLWALYVAVCKNDDHLHIEVVWFRQETFDLYRDRAADLVEARYPPNRISNTSSYFVCKFCDFHDICHHGAPQEQNCRTCVHSVALQPTCYYHPESDCYFTSNDRLPADAEPCDELAPHVWEARAGRKVPRWYCEKYRDMIPEKFMPKGCDAWEGVGKG